MVLPVHKLRDLQLTRSKQVNIISFNLLGLLTPVCSVIPICQIKSMLRHGDVTTFTIWGVVEVCVGVSADQVVFT